LRVLTYPNFLDRGNLLCLGHFLAQCCLLAILNIFDIEASLLSEAFSFSRGVQHVGRHGGENGLSTQCELIGQS